MKWTYKYKSFSQWNKWFAWFPVRINNTDTIVWLEVVMRKGVMNITLTHIYYQYKELQRDIL